MQAELTEQLVMKKINPVKKKQRTAGTARHHKPYGQIRDRWE